MTYEVRGRRVSRLHIWTCADGPYRSGQARRADDETAGLGTSVRYVAESDLVEMREHVRRREFDTIWALQDDSDVTRVDGTE